NDRKNIIGGCYAGKQANNKEEYVSSFHTTLPREKPSSGHCHTTFCLAAGGHDSIRRVQKTILAAVRPNGLLKSSTLLQLGVALAESHRPQRHSQRRMATVDVGRG